MIQLLTNFDEDFRPVADITLPVLLDYCQRHGYPSLTVTERVTDRAIVWDRIPLLLDNLGKAEWTCYMDTDILITNPSISLESFVDTDKPMLVSEDVNGVNLGVMFVRNCARSREILEEIWDTGNGLEITSEQHAVMWLLDNGELPDLEIVPQKLFNAYPYGLLGVNFPDGTWTPDDFALHAPGMTNEARRKLFLEVLG